MDIINDVFNQTYESHTGRRQPKCGPKYRLFPPGSRLVRFPR